MLNTCKHALLTSIACLIWPSFAASNEICNETDFAYRWNMMLIENHLDSTVDMDVLDRDNVPVPQAYIWKVNLFPHPTYKGGDRNVYAAMQPLAREFLPTLSESERECQIVWDNGHHQNNFGPLGGLLERLARHFE